jgi:nucleoside diphosphate kinase
MFLDCTPPWERSHVVLKSDALNRDLGPPILRELIGAGLCVRGPFPFRLAEMDVRNWSPTAEIHAYAAELFDYLTQPMALVVVEGLTVIARSSAIKRHIREVYGASGHVNMIHAPNTIAEAEREKVIFRSAGRRLPP